MKDISELENADEILNLPNSWEERGMEKGIEKVARRMLNEGSSIGFVSKVTGLEKEEVKKLLYKD